LVVQLGCFSLQATQPGCLGLGRTRRDGPAAPRQGGHPQAMLTVAPLHGTFGSSSLTLPRFVSD
jgi:hypothetical protein